MVTEIYLLVLTSTKKKKKTDQVLTQHRYQHLGLWLIP